MGSIETGDCENETTEENRFYSEDELHGMRAAGMEKPKSVTWSQWLSPKKLNSRHHIVCYLSAFGQTPKQISEQTGLSRNRVSALLANPKIRLEIQHLQKQMFAQDPRSQFSQMVPDAIRTINDVMMNPEEKGATRLAAANLTVERIMGKTPQTLEVGGNLIRALFERMDQSRLATEVLDISVEVPKLLPGPNPEDNVEDDTTPVLAQKEGTAEVDSWIEKNLGSS